MFSPEEPVLTFSPDVAVPNLNPPDDPNWNDDAGVVSGAEDDPKDGAEGGADELDLALGFGASHARHLSASMGLETIHMSQIQVELFFFMNLANKSS